MPEARRVTIYPLHDGWWFRVQGTDWRTIGPLEKARPYTTASGCRRRVKREYPNVEITTEERTDG